MNADEVAKQITYASQQSDRWLFLAAIAFICACGIVIIRYLVKQNEKQSERHGTLMEQVLKGLSESTSVIKEVRDWLHDHGGKLVVMIGAALALSACALSDAQRAKARETGSFLAGRIGTVVARVVITSAIQSLTEGSQADFLDSAAQGLRTLPAQVTSEDIDHVITIWTKPAPGVAPPPEIQAAARKVLEVHATNGAPPEVLAQGLNKAAETIRANSATP